MDFSFSMQAFQKILLNGFYELY